MKFISRFAELFRGWSRTDILAILAISISILSMWIAYRADKRAHQANMRGAEAVAAVLVPKIRELVKETDTSAMFIETFINHARQNPKDATEAGELAFEFLHASSLPEIELPAEHLALLTHSDGDAATKLAICISKRSLVQSDIKNLSTVTSKKISTEQYYTLSILPYRLRKLNESCADAVKSLVIIVPAMLIDEPLRGTLGEIADAQWDEIKRKESGPVGTLKLSTGKSKDNNK
ncbi:hypothetical protein [Janthinobacterium sp. BJB401]|uniref:hypothetical protein n=1 Tax=Janthinobacterium sp. BJB401 TaxID=2745934 RepID=UPI001596048C|nr:hypothetical protein [Janthinobacterium sp. BJB401]NVI84060.1 hypothetical protein [Janthinobacterium sp. BJB401]